jgi:hypothetical protein
MPHWIHTILPLLFWLAEGLTDGWFLPSLYAHHPASSILAYSKPIDAPGQRPVSAGGFRMDGYAYFMNTR